MGDIRIELISPMTDEQEREKYFVFNFTEGKYEVRLLRARVGKASPVRVRHATDRFC
jgi:hypothetical protein